MKNISRRILTGVLILPLLFLIIAFLPYYHNLAYCLLVLLITIIGTYEMNHNLESKLGNVPWTGYLGVILPIVEFVRLLAFPELDITLYTLAIIVGIVFSYEIFKGVGSEFKDSLSRIGRVLISIIYPSLFSVFMIKVAFLNNANWYIILFLILVFSCDSFAYFFGIAFGKNNKGYIKVSPNKSIAGYLGGIIVPSLLGALAPIVAPNQFTFSIPAGIVIGLLTAIFSCLGDLIESTFKRSAGIKDSGKAIPGRGGMLDSIDSIIIAIPVFILLVDIFVGI